jgi:hypothetical protein
MMKRFSPINNISGWVVFIAASFVYLSTIESTSSFWDCGEFIASAYKLEVGHPPGAPFFMLIGRFFTLFAKDDVTRVATMVNSLSALASALTIMFLFWTITHIARKIFVRENNYTPGITMAIIGSGLVGALAYAFSDTFWFSAVEGEVYATSSLFTAVVFWAILKWENIADEKYADRWIVLIAYLMGLSIGVHLLNLLAIPAIVLVYYFRKYKVTPFGLFAALFISTFILVFIQSGIIPHIVGLASSFELFFVNTLGMPYNSGIIVFMILLTGSVITGIVVTRNNISHFFNLAFTCLAVILLGYSSYAAIVIRSCANPPMNENNPSNVFSLLSYLNREQYGDRPLLKGQYFNAMPTGNKEGDPTYTKIDGKYVITNYKNKYKYDKEYMTFFPRMYSSSNEHVDAYISWTSLNESDLYEPRIDSNGNIMRDRSGKIVYNRLKPKRPPSFIHNLEFFIKYQLGHMYFRYFMWNFVGRQNDVQGHGDALAGNWISGIPFIDKAIVGSYKNMPDDIKNHPSRNRYYFLPLLLGLIGLKYHLRKNPENFLVVALLFILTGVAIVIYLNQTPVQPRERDYAYAASFYAFAIWIGLGVLGIINYINKKLQSGLISALTVTLCLLFVPGIMARENWDDHDRSGRYTASDVAYNYLNSCAPNAILFTNGDNDTFPLWYAQEVEGIRTDVRVVNLMLLNMDWYIDQMKIKAYESDPLPITLGSEKYRMGTRDGVYIMDKIDKFIDIKSIMEFVESDMNQTKLLSQSGEKYDYIPTIYFSLPVDSARVISNGTVRPEDADKIVKSINWKINARVLGKSELIVLDILANNNWERPVYYVSTGHEGLLNLDYYLQLEGLAYRLVPIKSEPEDRISVGKIDTEILYDNLMNRFKWRGLNDPDVYLDNYHERTLSIIRLRHRFNRLANELINEKDTVRALEVLDKCVALTPHKNVPYDMFMVSIAESYYRCKAYDKANAIIDKYAGLCDEYLIYYLGQNRNYVASNLDEIQFYLQVLRNILITARLYEQNEIAQRIEYLFNDLYQAYLEKAGT